MINFEQQRTNFQSRIQKVNAFTFDDLALELFAFQAKYNPLYAQFLTLLSCDPQKVNRVCEIPFLPISLFKNKEIRTGIWEKETLFQSSGTTQQITSKHAVRSVDWYKKVVDLGFKKFYGNPNDFCFLALLPSYLERSGSSLVLMVDHFIKQSKFKSSGFFLNDFEQLADQLIDLKKRQIPTILLGVSFGLLDFIERYQIAYPDLIVIETGGMKGRRKELTRSELHAPILNSFQVKTIHSEYGMTELFSQAYSKGNGIFEPSLTMKILMREISDPFCIIGEKKNGAINIIDLANIDTCAFIATDDLGRQYKDGTFEVLGRLDASDIRGCNLMVGEEV